MSDSVKTVDMGDSYIIMALTNQVYDLNLHAIIPSGLFLQKEFFRSILSLRLRWAKQVTHALYFVHGKHVIHGDLTCGNIFLDEHLNVKLADFGGSSIDGSPLLVQVTASHRYPGQLLSVQGDIFALGSTLYEIMAGVVPYHELTEEEIEARYKKGTFPKQSYSGQLEVL